MLENFIIQIQQYNPNIEYANIIKAYHFAESAHEGQLRKSGEKYFTHPLQVALILAELEMDENTIIAGLLHDVLEDTKYEYDEIAAEFGDEVASLVDGVTKLTRLKYESKEERQAENLRKMFLAMAKDIRVIIIKLADRLHNMRTLEYMNEEKKKEKAMETIEIYAPIADRLGISKIKGELEDTSLRFIDPEGYYELVEKINKKRGEREEYIENVINKLNDSLADTDIEYDITGRPKHFYSIYKKMVYQKKSFEEIFDLTAIRVIVDNIKDCYGVLGIVHTLWKPIPGRFKDYIAMPKTNMYQSLHTTVIGPKGEPFEIQIRTKDMHKIAEYGIAAHWKYKEGRVEEENIDNKLTWLRQMLEWQRDLKDPKEFVESLKIDLFTNQVFVFTPKGDVVELPVGSTPVDFAYKIHSGVGNSCIGGKVDGRIVPLDYKLKTGNIVEVITSSHSNGPSRDWLKFVKSTQAKNKIKQWYKKERKEENIVKGKDMLEKEVKRLGYSTKEFLQASWLNSAVKKLSLNAIEDLYASLGYGGISLNQVMPKLKEKYRVDHKDDKKMSIEEEIAEKSKKKSDKSDKKHKKQDQGITVKGIDSILVRFAKCCSPVPGDEIIGFITRGRGITIHRSDCPNIKNEDTTAERFIDVEWNRDKENSYETGIQIIAPDKKGLLSEVTNLISELNLEVVGINARITKEKVAIINLTILIFDTGQLKILIKKLKNKPEIMDVKRVTS
ncbi:MAG: bifunctional (p)ppGpp synthetase/guanosine-3',5'-bis(diphosphate) 3'-pyrophosphohydrolase [Peptostreptococcaceae bacterium]|nr:bifunctional (p)ppGpp synthetase/guanosine-3',5'-bis(diphosphate) 3'-pyrophosphohydrolase [Peptostreptococcaceae bacterium]